MSMDKCKINGLETDELLTTTKDALERNDNQTIAAVKDTVPKNARTILWYMSFFGFGINYMQRMNLNIAIVGMVISKSHLNKTISHLVNSTISPQQSNWSYDTTIIGTNLTTIVAERFSLEQTILNALNINYERNGFSWNEYEQGIILGSFFWLHWLTQIPGGVLARKYGTKMVFGYGNFLGCLLCSFIPIASYIGYEYLVILRIIQGVICGGMWPSMHNIVAKWIPPNERSTFMASYMGSSVGVSIFFPLFGYLMEVTRWEWVFHICSLISIIWFTLWSKLVYDSPAEHPYINPKERSYIENCLSSTVNQTNKAPTPWNHILKSKVVWVNVLSFFGSAWCFYTLLSNAPAYFVYIHGWDIKMSGLLSGAPHLIRAVFAYFFSIWCDWLLREDKLSRNKVRMIALATCNGLAGLFSLFLAFSGSSSLMAVINFSIALAASGGITSGPFAAFVDMSPNFASILLGIATMFSILSGFLAPMLIGKLTLNNQTPQQWQYVFLISAAVGLGTTFLHALFSDSSVQYWNNIGESKGAELAECFSENRNKTEEKKCTTINNVSS